MWGERRRARVGDVCCLFLPFDHLEWMQTDLVICQELLSAREVAATEGGDVARGLCWLRCGISRPHALGYSILIEGMGPR